MSIKNINIINKLMESKPLISCLIILFKAENSVYRIHSNSNTERHLHNGKEIENLRQVIEIIQPYLPATIASQLSNKAGKNWGLYAIQDLAQQMLAQGDFVAATIQMQEALKCSRSLKVIGGSSLLLLRIGKVWLQKTLNKNL